MLANDLVKNLSTLSIITIKTKQISHDVDPIIRTERNIKKNQFIMHFLMIKTRNLVERTLIENLVYFVKLLVIFIGT